jgi:hypothetical protein
MTPRELDHPTTHARIACFGKSSLAAFLAALDIISEHARNYLGAKAAHPACRYLSALVVCATNGAALRCRPATHQHPPVTRVFQQNL